MKYFITGVSSGVGRTLTKKLILKGETVWGVARREHLLKELKGELNNSARFFYTCMDQTKDNDWATLIDKFKGSNFTPNIIIFNAAISLNDLKDGIDIETMEKTFNINFLGVMKGIKTLLPLSRSGDQFIAISSFSALKGSGVEGIGYAASKAALSIAFESLYQKYKDKKIKFKTIFFGPINGGMSPFKKNMPFVLSKDKAVDSIIHAVQTNKGLFYYPGIIFFIFKVIKLLPSGVYFRILSWMEFVHSRLEKNYVN